MTDGGFTGRGAASALKLKVACFECAHALRATPAPVTPEFRDRVEHPSRSVNTVRKILDLALPISNFLPTDLQLVLTPENQTVLFLPRISTGKSQFYNFSPRKDVSLGIRGFYATSTFSIVTHQIPIVSICIAKVTNNCTIITNCMN
jgi:hypothetical protein